MNNEKDQQGVLLVNTGTPSEPNTISIRKYLKEFLLDKRIVQLPRAVWLPILYLLILPFRPMKKINNYNKIWMDEGSPLLVFTKRLLQKLNASESKKGAMHIDIAMRYGEPNIKKKLMIFQEKNINKLTVVPLFPQYSFSTTESVKDKVKLSIIELNWKPKINYVEEYCKENLYIDSMVKNINNNWEKKNGKLIFSYHGLPKKYVDRGDTYYESCMETSRLIAKRIGLQKEEYITSFHSKFGFGEWTKPYTEELLLELPKQDITSICVVSPSFAIDCLETLEEIAIQFKDEFLKAGGKEFKYIPCLNAQNDHVSLIEKLVTL